MKFFLTYGLVGLANSTLLKQQVDQFSMPTPYELSQVEAAKLITKENRCTFAHDRVKNAKDIFYGVQASNKEYRDETFPHEEAIIWEDHLSNQGDLRQKNRDASWVHSLDIAFPES